MDAFEYEALPGRIVFGAGAWQKIPDELSRLGARHVLVICGAGRQAQAEDLAALLGEAAAGIFARARPHVPAEQAEEVRGLARRLGADALVSIGGGTPVGLAKAVAVELSIPVVAVPTTYAGSEMTDLVGITRDGVKRTSQDRRMLPRLVIYDPLLTVGLDAHTTATTGMNAVAHCVEALYAKRANPVTGLLAEAGLAALIRALPNAVRAPSDLQARGEALYGAYLAGSALGAAGIAVHHKICHVLGASYGIGHGDANAVILPHAVRYNQDAAPAAIKRVAAVLGGGDAAAKLFEFVQELGAPSSLSDLGLDHGALDRIAALTVETTTFNPRPVDHASLLVLLENAYHGRRP